MKNTLTLLIICLILIGCDTSHSPKSESELIKSSNLNSEDEKMVMLKQNVQIRPSEYKLTYTSNIIGYWSVINYYVKNSNEELWHLVKYASHNKAFEFKSKNIYSEMKLYNETDSVGIISGEYLFSDTSDEDSLTIIVTVPHISDSIKHKNGDIFYAPEYSITWINDSMIYMNSWHPIAKFNLLMELKRIDR